MQIQEFKDENGSYNHKDNFNIKKYIPFIEKKILVEDIIDGCLETNENGLLVVNNFMKKMVLDLKVVIAYTDIEFGEEIVNDYDFMVENKIIDKIIESIDDSELDFIESMVNKEIDQKIRIENSIEGILANKLDKLIDKLPTDKQIKSLSKSLVKDINKMDWDKLPMLKDMWLSANGKQGDVVNG